MLSRDEIVPTNMSADRMTFPFMFIQQDHEGLSRDYMSCFVNALRDVLLFHGVHHLRRMLVQPLSLVIEVDKDRIVWLHTNTESGVSNPHFYYGFQAYWKVIHNYYEAIDAICSCQENGKIAIFRTDWSKVPYSSIYMNRRADWHIALAVAYFKERDQIYIADRNNARSHIPFSQNRGYIQGSTMTKAFDNLFALLEYNFVEPELSWTDILHKLIKESILNMNSQLGWITSHQEFGFQSLEHLSWMIHNLEFGEMTSKQLQWFFRGSIPRSIRNSIIGNRKLFLTVLNETYPLERCGLEPLAANVQQGWHRLSRLLAAVGRDLNATSRQDCLDQIGRVLELEQKLIVLLEQL